MSEISIPLEANDTAGSDAIIVCDESLDIRHVSDMKILFAGALAANKTVTLQADKVERADTAGLQLFCAFFKDAHASGMKIVWHEPSETLRKSAGLLGLTEVLGLDNTTN